MKRLDYRIKLYIAIVCSATAGLVGGIIFNSVYVGVGCAVVGLAVERIIAITLGKRSGAK